MFYANLYIYISKVDKSQCEHCFDPYGLLVSRGKRHSAVAGHNSLHIKTSPDEGVNWMTVECKRTFIF